MARILVNYIYNKEKDEFKIQRDSEFVFADMKIAVLETEDEIKTPLVVPIKGILTVVEKDEYEKLNKRFRLTADNYGIVKEDPNGEEVWLPKDTDVSKLRFLNGRLVLLDDSSTPKQNKKSSEKRTKGDLDNGNNE